MFQLAQPSGQYLLSIQVYNCAKLPAICANVQRHNPPANAVLANGVLSLTYDTDEDHNKARRSQQCPQDWKLTHPCPETTFVPPLQVVPAGAYVGIGTGSIRNPRRLDPFLPLEQPGSNMVCDHLLLSLIYATKTANCTDRISKIDAGDGTSSGMIWSCDEWPPASFVDLPLSRES